MIPDGILSGVRVVELGHYIAVPFCAQMLADQGADVIKVEQPGSEISRTAAGYFNAQNRNKRSVIFDLKSADGQAALHALIDTADILVTNFSAGVPERLGYGYEQVKATNPGLIYVHVTGFGCSGPYASQPAFDGIIQAMSGMVHLTGEPGGPPVLAGLFVPDHVAGLYAAVASVLGLHRRRTTGQGMYVDLSMLDGMLSLLGAALSEVAEHGRSPSRTGGRVRGSYAGIYPTVDGYVFLAPMAPHMWRGLARVIGQPRLLEYVSTELGGPDTRMEHRDHLDSIIEEWSRARTMAQVIEAMATVDIPCSQIYSLEAILQDPHIAYRKMIRQIPLRDSGGVMHVTGSPLPVSEQAFCFGPPMAGEQTEEILADLGLPGTGPPRPSYVSPGGAA